MNTTQEPCTDIQERAGLGRNSWKSSTYLAHVVDMQKERTKPNTGETMLSAMLDGWNR